VSASTTGRGALITGGLGAVSASACCLGPLILVMFGFSGTWIGSLTALEPYRPWFLGIALLAMVFARRRIYRAAATCEPGELCASPTVRRAYKAIFWVVALLIAVALGFPYVLPLFY